MFKLFKDLKFKFRSLGLHHHLVLFISFVCICVCVREEDLNDCFSKANLLPSNISRRIIIKSIEIYVEICRLKFNVSKLLHLGDQLFSRE